MSILTATKWATNAEMIEDVARLGYLEGHVLDLTYGYGTFWKNWTPAELTTNDLSPDKGEFHYDFRHTPWGSNDFDSVVFDPPYKLNGTSRPEDYGVDERYGVDVPMRWQDKFELIADGLTEALRLARKHVLLKCMDQVVSGAKRWQTFEMASRVIDHGGWVLADRFDLLVTPRPQPEGRRQVHSQGNYSTLLVFERE